jgi:hypothetical protein
MRVPANGNNSAKRKKRIVVCVPVIASRVGVSWNSAQAMSAGATIKAFDVLRRELRDSGQAGNISVTVADVGSVGSPSHSYNSGAAAYMSDWSPNIRSTYGASFLGALEHSRLNPRTPDNIQDAVNKLASLVDEPRFSLFGKFPFFWKARDRELVGAGGTLFLIPSTYLLIILEAYTYMLASKLPEWILDGILSVPARLAELRNTIIPVILHPEESKPVEEEEEEEEAEEIDIVTEEQIVPELGPESEKATLASSGYSSEAELLSLNSNDHIASSWVSLNENQQE